MICSFFFFFCFKNLLLIFDILGYQYNALSSFFFSFLFFVDFFYLFLFLKNSIFKYFGKVLTHSLWIVSLLHSFYSTLLGLTRCMSDLYSIVNILLNVFFILFIPFFSPNFILYNLSRSTFVWYSDPIY